MFLVVLAHACASKLQNRNGSVTWDVANSLVIITEVAVPLFFMISGATILNSKKTTSIEYLFKHRLPRVLVPFIIWSIITAYVARQIDGTYTYHSFHAIGSINVPSTGHYRLLVHLSIDIDVFTFSIVESYGK